MRCAALPPAQLPGSNCRRPEPLRICPKATSPATGKPASAKAEAFARAGEQSFRMKECPWRYRPLVRHGSVSSGALSPLQLSGLTCRRPGVWPAYAHLSKSVQSGGWKAGACEGGSIRPARPGKPIVQEGWRAPSRCGLRSAWSGIVGALLSLRLSGLTGTWPGPAHLSESAQSGNQKAGACEGGTIRPRGQPSLRKRECPWRYRPSALGRARHRRGRHSAAWPVTGLGTPEDFMRKPRSSWSKGATGYSPEKQASQYCGQALLRPLASPTAR